MNLFKKCFAVTVFFALTTFLSVMVYAEEPKYGLVVNGAAVVFEDGSEPVNVDGRLLFPLRTVFNALNDGKGSMDWDSESNMITLSLKDIEMKLWIGNAEAEVNGSKIAIPDGVAPIIHNDRTYLPLRFIAEQIGMIVGWNADYLTASVVDKNVYDTIKELLSFSGNKMSNKMSMDLNMNVDTDVSLITEEGTVNQQSDTNMNGRYDIDTENKFMHMIVSTTVLDVDIESEVYMLQDKMYIKVGEYWQSIDLSGINSSLGGNPSSISNYLDMADVSNLAESLESYDPYLTFGFSWDDNGDVVISGIMYLPSEYMNNVLGSTLSSIDETGGMQTNIQPILVKYILNKETMYIKSISMDFFVSMNLDILGYGTEMNFSYNMIMDNFDFAPKFDSIIPDEVINNMVDVAA